MKKLYKVLLSIILFVAIERFCHYQTAGFRYDNIISDLPYNPEWETSQPKNDGIKNILSQTFHFLGNGGQCYAFISEDKKTVLKVFKHHHMRPHMWYDALPLPMCAAHKDYRLIKRLKHLFASAKISSDYLSFETGVIYAHLNATDYFHQTITLHDKLGIKHSYDADKLTFVLQKMATLTYPTLDDLMKKGELETAQKCLSSLINLIVNRCQKGICDRDPIIDRNFGYIGTQAVEIDIGSYLIDPAFKTPFVCKKELYYETLRLKKWIAKHHPSLTPHLEAELAQAFDHQS